MLRHCILLLVVLLAGIESSSAATPAENLARKPHDWFRSDEGKESMACILSRQSRHGDWPKNTDTTQKRYSGDRADLQGTFDNGATIGELMALGRAFQATGNETYKEAFLIGFDHIVKAQYPNGGWPQYYPLSQKYHRHITFNDGTMIRILEFLQEITSSDDFDFLDDPRREAALTAVERGKDCIVKCQIIVNGKPTVWCAQHDEVTLQPADARSYELASLSGAESAGILRYLMNLENPSSEVVRAVRHGAAWFDANKIEGVRYQKSHKEPALTPDPNARPLWARFYELESFRPFFCDRDGIVKYDIEEIGVERRGGYTWYGNWGEGVAKAYAAWPHR